MNTLESPVTETESKFNPLRLIGLIMIFVAVYKIWGGYPTLLIVGLHFFLPERYLV